MLAPAAISQTCGPTYDACVENAHPALSLVFGKTVNDSTTGATFHTTAAILPSQPGFDPANPKETSIAIPQGAYLESPNSTLGDLDWNQPFNLGLHIHNLNLNRSRPTTVTAFSKGDLSNRTPHYAFTLEYNGSAAQFCFTESAPASPFSAVIRACTIPSSGQDTPNSYDYDLLVTNDGTGSPTGLKLYVNGLNLNDSFYASPWKFGSAQVTLSGSGSGYADATPFKATGGGPHCTLAGTLLATAGVPNGVAYGKTSNFGCIAAPAITLTHPTGTGAVLTATLTPQTISSPEPLYLGGKLVSGKPTGFADDNPVRPPLQIEKFFLIKGPPSLALVHGLFTHTLFYRRILGPPPPDPQRVILTEDGCGDADNLFALALLINLHRLGYIHLLAVTQTTNDGPASATFRQMLDSATLAKVPVLSVTAPTPGPGTGNALCKATTITAHNPATPLLYTAYPQAAAAYRKLLAHVPNASVIMLNGGSLRDLSDLLQSPPDATSPIPGLKLFNAKVKAVYLQGLGCCFPFKNDNTLLDWQAAQYVLTHNGPTPMIFFGGLPSDSGPGPLFTRPPTDPLFLFAQSIHADTRQAFDSLPAAALVTPIFSNASAAVDGTVTLTGPSAGVTTSSPASHHLFYPLAPLMTTLPGRHLYTWFLNSVINLDPANLDAPTPSR